MSLVTRGLKGFVEGVLVDTTTWAMTAFFPGLVNSTPLKVPGYKPSGISWDDLLSLGTGFGVSVYGAFTANAGLAVEGLGMMAGAFTISRFQPGPAKKPW
jgi:hypothetical protein